MKRYVLLIFLNIPFLLYAQILTISELIKIKNSDIGELTELLEIKKFALGSAEYDTLILEVKLDSTKKWQNMKVTYNPPSDWKYKEYRFYKNGNADNAEYFVNVIINRNRISPSSLVYQFPGEKYSTIRESILKNGFIKSRAYEERGEIVTVFRNNKYEIELVNSPDREQNLKGEYFNTGRRTYYLVLVNN
ncbi:MAG: hypothetical protein H7Y07_14875 [Pyrinomonadaceae bacterium]|nr:hypothetical protein [Sphingobacteriaceae bacterium]